MSSVLCFSIRKSDSLDLTVKEWRILTFFTFSVCIHVPPVTVVANRVDQSVTRTIGVLTFLSLLPTTLEYGKWSKSEKIIWFMLLLCKGHPHRPLPVTVNFVSLGFKWDCKDFHHGVWYWIKHGQTTFLWAKPSYS